MEKAELKLVKKNLGTEIKKIAKKQGFKSIASYVYKVEAGFFLSTLFFTKETKDGLSVTIWMDIKPYEYDNLFWTIFDMSDNIHSKDSIRANGAFTAPSIRIEKETFILAKAEDTNNVSQQIVKYIVERYKEYLDSIEYSVVKFNSEILGKENYPDKELIKMLAYIQNGDISEALKLSKKEIENGHRGGYQNNDQDIYVYIKEYCERKLS
ncbi:hypothetical protein [Listeria booriae]|uniref:hypothetical protein n=1 Tax=Listeria booriae TaxID=1552123 RepID=UPI00162A8A09|nr:hypothetical protein [Listeria booriae]MBC1513850.1 hypothetical protein [Listeria booriae]MBC6152906.1 hypothetical protein [Listeria booriae]MBC6307224.1 hypothetical protein [Listeria booriae]